VNARHARDALELCDHLSAETQPHLGEVLVLDSLETGDDVIGDDDSRNAVREAF
jgi:hypothetical protein